MAPYMMSLAGKKHLPGVLGMTVILVAVVFMATRTTAEADVPLVLNDYGRVSFSDLGWTDNVELTADSPSTTLQFSLPEGVKQGDPFWYGVRLVFDWHGNPGKPGEFAHLYGIWNEGAVYQFQTERLNSTDQGFEWSMVDLVNGASAGYELTPSMSVASSNVAQFRSITPGPNELELFLQLSDASNKDIRVVVSNESSIFATSWQPTFIDGKAEVDIDGETATLRIQGKNLGWGAPHLSTRAIIWTEGKQETFNHSIAPLPPLGDVLVEEHFTRNTDHAPERIDVELDWGSGRTFFLVLDASQPTGRIPLIDNAIFRSTIGVMVATVILWVSLPMLVSQIRRARQS